jgi:hypothetical protein
VPLNSIAALRIFITAPETVVEPAPVDVLQNADPEELRLAAERARTLALAAVDAATVDRLNEDAADFEDLADNIEGKPPAS